VRDVPLFQIFLAVSLMMALLALICIMLQYHGLDMDTKMGEWTGFYSLFNL
jgi:hypothetical protein